MTPLERRIRALQDRLGVRADGDVGPVTLAAIEDALGRLEAYEDAASEDITVETAMPHQTARRIDWIVLHHNGVAGRTVDDIRRSHRARGWRDIGYHYLVHEDGTSHVGRPADEPGAHAQGLNAYSIGICVIGNGNERDFNADQYATLERLLRRLIRSYGLSPNRVIGHREVNPYVDVIYRTTKVCPGSQVDMSALRSRLALPDRVG